VAPAFWWGEFAKRRQAWCSQKHWIINTKRNSCQKLFIMLL
jgi:hypothetical protein